MVGFAGTTQVIMCEALSARLVVVTSIICYQCSLGALMCKAWLSSYPHVHGIVLRIVWVTHGCCAKRHIRDSWKEETSGSWDSEVKVYQQGPRPLPNPSEDPSLLLLAFGGRQPSLVVPGLWTPHPCPRGSWVFFQSVFTWSSHKDTGRYWIQGPTLFPYDLILI